VLHTQGFNERSKRKTAVKLKSFDMVLSVNLLLHKNVEHVKSGLQPEGSFPQFPAEFSLAAAFLLFGFYTINIVLLLTKHLSGFLSFLSALKPTHTS
jgi:hypothetical protein